MIKNIKNKVSKIDYKKIIQSSFFKDSSYMVFSTVAMQLIAIATIPVLTRLFSPEAFGFHATYRATLVILSVILTLRLEAAIVLPKTDRNKNIIYISTFINSLIIVTILIIAYYLLKILGFDILVKTFDISNVELLVLIIFGSLLVGFTNINQNRLVSLKAFKTIAFSRLILPVAFFIISLLLYYTYDNYLSLIIAQSAAYFFLFLYLQKNIKFNIKGISKKVYLNTINKYNDIIKYTSSNALLNTVSVNVPSLILLSLFGAKVLGFYAIGAKLISLPTQLVSSSFSQVFYKKSVDIYNHDIDNLYPFVRKVMFSLLLLGTITFTLAYFIIPYVVPFVLGKEWVGAIKIMQYLCLWQALMIANGPVSSLTILLKRQKELLLFQILFLTARVFSIWYPYYLGYEAKYSILAFALIGLLFNLILFAYLLYIAKNSNNQNHYN